MGLAQRYKKGKVQEKEKCTYASKVLLDGKLYEQGYNGVDAYFISRNGKQPELVSAEKIIKPITGDAISEGAVLLPSDAQEFGSVRVLVSELRKHIHKYCDISLDYEEISAYYILLSWVSDKVNTVPYLRVLGDTGVGKSRFLDVVGRLCYKASIVSGAITPAPIFRMIKAWRGTLIIDEADFGKSDEKSEVIKILNCGFERGKPNVRCHKDNPDDLQFLPNFGPKIIATRRTFADKALEARCLTYRMTETLRKDIPTQLPPSFFEKEAELRNKLLMFRFLHRDKVDANDIQRISLGDIEPRLKQAAGSFAVLFANIEPLMERFRTFLRKYNSELVEERAATLEGLIVAALCELEGQEISARMIADHIKAEHGLEKISAQGVGSRLKSLGLTTQKTRSVRVVRWDKPLIDNLKRRYVPECGDLEARPTIDATLATVATDGGECSECGNHTVDSSQGCHNNNTNQTQSQHESNKKKEELVKSTKS